MTTADRGDHEAVRLAFVGLGWWGGELARAATRSGRARVETCFARSPEARERFASAHGARPAPSLDAVLENTEVEAVVLATPHSTHLPLIRAAADAGKHVFVEKPLTVVFAEAEEAVKAARAAGIILQVGHNRRRVAATRALRKRIDSGAFGLIHLIETRMFTPSDLEPRGGWRGDPEECPLGGMTALGVHMIDNIHYLGGAVRQVYAQSRRVLGRGRLDDVTTLSMQLESGALATLSTSVVLPRSATVAVHGHEGSGWSERDGEELYLQTPDERSRQPQDIQSVDAVADQFREFADCVRSGRDPEVAGEQGRDVIAVLEAARRSVDRSAPVTVEEVRAGGHVYEQAG